MANYCLNIPVMGAGTVDTSVYPYADEDIPLVVTSHCSACEDTIDTEEAK